MTIHPAPRVVFDTNVVISAVLFRMGRLAWLRDHWQEGVCIPLASWATLDELERVLGYSKFKLSAREFAEVMNLYLPYCDILTPTESCTIRCRDPKDQALLDLAHCGKADILVTGDQDLLSLTGQTLFAIETPEEYRLRIIASG